MELSGDNEEVNLECEDCLNSGITDTGEYCDCDDGLELMGSELACEICKQNAPYCWCVSREAEDGVVKD